MALGVLNGNCRHLNALSAKLCQCSGAPRRALAEELCSQESECSLTQRSQKHSIGIRRLTSGADALAKRLNFEFLVVVFGQPGRHGFFVSHEKSVLDYLTADWSPEQIN